MIVQHITRSRDRSWCGLYVGFHQPKPQISEDDFKDKREKGLGRNVCRSCRKAFEASETRGVLS